MMSSNTMLPPLNGTGVGTQIGDLTPINAPQADHYSKGQSYNWQQAAQVQINGNYQQRSMFSSGLKILIMSYHNHFNGDVKVVRTRTKKMAIVTYVHNDVSVDGSVRLYLKGPNVLQTFKMSANIFYQSQINPAVGQCLRSVAGIHIVSQHCLCKYEEILCLPIACILRAIVDIANCYMSLRQFVSCTKLLRAKKQRNLSTFLGFSLRTRKRRIPQKVCSCEN